MAHWRIEQAQVDTVLDLAASLRSASLAEPGCLGYEVLQNVEDPTTVVLIERYRDDDALHAHQSSPHYQELVVGQIRPLLAGRDVEVLQAR